MDGLDLWNTERFMYSFSWVHQSNFIWQTTTLLFYLSSFKRRKNQIWPRFKIGQGQPRVNSLTNGIKLKCLMLHIKFQAYQLTGSGEDVWNFTIYVARTIWRNFSSPFSPRLHMNFHSNPPNGFRGDVLWKCWRMTMTDEREIIIQ